MARPKEYHVKYLGGWHEFPSAKTMNIYLSDNGITAIGWFLRRHLFTIPWEVIADVSEVRNSTQVESALGGMMSGLGMIAAGSPASSGGIPGQIAGNTLATVGSSMKSTQTENLLQITVEVSGVKAVALFEVPAPFWNKRPVLALIAEINKVRIARNNRAA